MSSQRNYTITHITSEINKRRGQYMLQARPEYILDSEEKFGTYEVDWNYVSAYGANYPVDENFVKREEVTRLEELCKVKSTYEWTDITVSCYQMLYSNDMVQYIQQGTSEDLLIQLIFTLKDYPTKMRQSRMYDDLISNISLDLETKQAVMSLLSYRDVLSFGNSIKWLLYILTNNKDVSAATYYPLCRILIHCIRHGEAIVQYGNTTAILEFLVWYCLHVISDTDTSRLINIYDYVLSPVANAGAGVIVIALVFTATLQLMIDRQIGEIDNVQLLWLFATTSLICKDTTETSLMMFQGQYTNLMNGVIGNICTKRINKLINMHASKRRDVLAIVLTLSATAGSKESMCSKGCRCVSADFGKELDKKAAVVRDQIGSMMPQYGYKTRAISHVWGQQLICNDSLTVDALEKLLCGELDWWLDIAQRDKFDAKQCRLEYSGQTVLVIDKGVKEYKSGIMAVLALLTSEWQLRGWTYQESRLARDLLIRTNDGVYCIKVNGQVVGLGDTSIWHSKINAWLTINYQEVSDEQVMLLAGARLWRQPKDLIIAAGISLGEYTYLGLAKEKPLMTSRLMYTMISSNQDNNDCWQPQETMGWLGAQWPTITSFNLQVKDENVYVRLPIIKLNKQSGKYTAYDERDELTNIALAETSCSLLILQEHEKVLVALIGIYTLTKNGPVFHRAKFGAVVITKPQTIQYEPLESVLFGYKLAEHKYKGEITIETLQKKLESRRELTG